MKIGIIILATNAYFCLGVRFIKRFMHFYKGDKSIAFFLFTNINPEDYVPDEYDVQYIHTENNNWVDGTNLKFTSILSLEKSNGEYSPLSGITHLFYFDADTNIDKEFTEEWFIGESVAGQHYGDLDWMKDVKGFERNPKSRAYVPYNTPLPQIYTYGAFWGGSVKWVIEFCKTMLAWQKADKQWGFEPGTNDESYSNCYFHHHPPEKLVLCKDFKFLISDKGGIMNMRNTHLDTSKLKRKLLAHKDDLIDIKDGIVVCER
jgi:hypothetical protein